MTASSVDTAELPRVAPWPRLGRIELRAVRRQARRQRQLYALLGVGAMALALGTTIAVLGVVR